jgi:hypothetical protein
MLSMHSNHLVSMLCPFNRPYIGAMAVLLAVCQADMISLLEDYALTLDMLNKLRA